MPTAASARAARRLGARVRALRFERGWTQETLAQHAGLHEKYPFHVERGARDIRFSTLCALADAFGITPAELVDALPADPPHH
ncbi:MAG: helix-turn-helix transcriptional regulator [Actinobacteria bacterium]|nr:helix-turn-helix transcriptional regulator [Actinomycetota bacterium]